MIVGLWSQSLNQKKYNLKSCAEIVTPLKVFIAAYHKSTPKSTMVLAARMTRQLRSEENHEMTDAEVTLLLHKISGIGKG